ncbi:MAG: hypothetical protein EOP04_05600 [Proteobacteria bacterium]|nr:MAG: hypothetical protein EOP04_05600 [Pseudomonadota bacterium]
MAVPLFYFAAGIGTDPNQFHRLKPAFMKFKTLGLLENGVWIDEANVNTMPDNTDRPSGLTNTIQELALLVISKL